MATNPPPLPRGALATAGIGLSLLILCIVLAFLESSRTAPDCPSTPTPTPDPKRAVYSVQDRIRLGQPICVGINAPVYFAEEQAVLKEIQSLTEAVKTAQRAQSEAEARAKLLTGEAKAAADREAQAAAAKTKEAEKSLGDARTASGQLSFRREVVLFVDEIEAPSKKREIDLKKDGDKWVWRSFPLHGANDATSDDAKRWRQILGGFTTSGERRVQVGLATADSDQTVRVRETLPDMSLQVYKPVIFYAGLAGLLLFAIGVGWLGWNSGLLRDGGAGTQFSLGRVQMGLWLVLVTGGFLFIWLVTEQWRGVVAGGVVALLGISAGTGVAARMADDKPPLPSLGFLKDLVNYTDAEGPALHRIQLIVWTLILGAIFVWTVFAQLAFADFDTNLLLLVGIAGGTYVGFKFRE